MGRLGGKESMVVHSEMNNGGVIFGDGIEEDFLQFGWGRVATVGIAEQKLRLAG